MFNYETDPWLETYSGRVMSLTEPQEESVDIVDIAVALSNQCRFNGHVKQFYSVAEHSVLLCNYVESRAHTKWEPLTMLLHDAAEAYVGDMAAPLKAIMPEFREIEHRIEQVIAVRYGIALPLPRNLKELDVRILRDEHEQVMPTSANNWPVDNLEPLRVRIEFLPPHEAKRRFLNTYERLLANLSSN